MKWYRINDKIINLEKVTSIDHDTFSITFNFHNDEYTTVYFAIDNARGKSREEKESLKLATIIAYNKLWEALQEDDTLRG